MGDDKATLTNADIEQYLQDHPDLFLQQPQLLELLELNASPEGTISLAQRQLQRLQEKNQQLNEQLHALIDNAHSNNELQQRVHALCLRLLDAPDLKSVIDALVKELKHEFSADDVALRLFYSADKPQELPKLSANVAQLHADDKKLRSFDNLLSKQQPVCGRLTKAQKQILFSGQADQIQSVACLPLGHEPCAGLLAIGSHDANRFHADMATDYLSFLGEVFMRILRQYCHSHHEQ
ncbi:DUF484 family protein [Methylophaga thiooxydans]|uniref:Phytochrome sensor protein n=1 Tax=Methylophaga thiooxydans DMS010 TaxID=637616 RepID=C0N8U6_9GAMM|nr:DUF484 family protein [Methylophaga thiooxydans]EEF78822.1 conserved hypothetical protein [Methylophaga thiooxydans DMS010]